MAEGKGIILFDMSRLISKSKEAYPTGIDRVDIRYAKYLHDRFGEDCVFVAQRHGRLYLYERREAAKAIANLWQRWIMGEPLTRTPIQMPKFMAPTARGTGKGPIGRKDDRFLKEDIEFLFHLGYLERVRFVLTNDLTSHIPVSLLWFLRVPRWISLPAVLLCVSSITLFSLVTWLGKMLNGAGKLIGKGVAKLKTLVNRPGCLAKTGLARHRSDETHLDPKLAEFLEGRKGRRLTLVNSSHHGLGSKDIFFELKFRYGADFVFFLHDIIPILFPEYVREDTVPAHHKRMQSIANFKPFLIVNSTETRKTVESYFGERGWPVPRTDVAFIGVEEKFLSRTASDAVLSPGPNHFVLLGTIEPRKNHLLILNLWRDLVESGVQNMPKLFVIGRRGWENENILQMLDRCPAVKEHVIELSGVSDQRIMEIMRSARALLFPSFAEGWGMPVAEALSMGVPAICSDIPVLKEVGQGIPDYIHPLDFRVWRDTILSYNEPNSPQRAQQLKRLEAYAPPLWENHWGAIEVALGS